MKLPRNDFKRALVSGRKQIGLWTQLASNISAEVLAYSGFDWLVVDTEHAPNDTRSVLLQLQVLAVGKAMPVVRIAWNDMILFKQYLDIGAQTLLVPFVETAEEARQVVSYSHYPPEGVRGVALSHRANRYGRIDNYHHHAGEEICLLVQIESERALDNLAEIAAVEGIDGVFIGPSDLAASMGHLTDTAHADVQAAIERALEVSTRVGKAAGILAPIEAEARRFLDMGFTFVAVGSDISLLARSSEALAGAFKEKTG